MNPVLVKRLVRRLLPVAPFIAAIIVFHVYQDRQSGLPLTRILILNGVPLFLLGVIFTGMLWYLSRPVPGVPDAEAAIEVRRRAGMRWAALVSTVVHVILALGLILVPVTVGCSGVTLVTATGGVAAGQLNSTAQSRC